MIPGSGGSSGPVPAGGDHVPVPRGGDGGPDPSRSRNLAAVDAEIQPRAATGVLADRIAAALVHREPGWRLPRRSALARRYNVGMPEIDAAISELVRRSLIRRLPDGQLYRASPAEYLIPVEGLVGLATRLDPMGGEVTCQARHVSQRDAPQDVAWALGVDGEARVRIVRSVWAAAGEPVAISTAYVREAFADSLAGEDPGFFEDMLSPVPAASSGGAGSSGDTLYARAADLELSPPQPSVARSLRLAPGQPAISVTIRFDDLATGEPAGLTVVILRSELFRVVIHAGGSLPPQVT
jgi:DNA-binding GntR family transcriptional regulator